MRPAGTDGIPELKESKSVPYGGGKEQELTHGGKVVKTKVGNFGGILGNSGYEDGVGKKIGVDGSKLLNLSSLLRPRLTQWW